MIKTCVACGKEFECSNGCHSKNTFNSCRCKKCCKTFFNSVTYVRVRRTCFTFDPKSVKPEKVIFT